MRFSTIKHSYFPVFVSLALGIYMAQQLSFSLPSPVNNHLNDLLCMPIVLKICQFMVRRIKKDGKLRIPPEISLTLTLMYALYFELLLPKFNMRYTADFLDVVCYFTGCLFFIMVEGLEIGKTLSYRKSRK